MLLSETDTIAYYEFIDTLRSADVNSTMVNFYLTHAALYLNEVRGSGQSPSDQNERDFIDMFESVVRLTLARITMSPGYDSATPHSGWPTYILNGDADEFYSRHSGRCTSTSSNMLVAASRSLQYVGRGMSRDLEQVFLHDLGTGPDGGFGEENDGYQWHLNRVNDMRAPLLGGGALAAAGGGGGGDGGGGRGGGLANPAPGGNDALPIPVNNPPGQPPDALHQFFPPPRPSTNPPDSELWLAKNYYYGRQGIPKDQYLAGRLFASVAYNPEAPDLVRAEAQYVRAKRAHIRQLLALALSFTHARLFPLPAFVTAFTRARLPSSRQPSFALIHSRLSEYKTRRSKPHAPCSYGHLCSGPVCVAHTDSLADTTWASCTCTIRAALAGTSGTRSACGRTARSWGS